MGGLAAWWVSETAYDFGECTLFSAVTKEK